MVADSHSQVVLSDGVARPDPHTTIPNDPVSVSMRDNDDDSGGGGGGGGDDDDDGGHRTTNSVKAPTTTTKSKMAPAPSSPSPSSTTTPSSSGAPLASAPPIIPTTSPPTRDMINPCLLLLAILYVLSVALAIVSRPRILDTLLLFAIGLLPVFLILRFVHVHLCSGGGGSSSSSSITTTTTGSDANDNDVHWTFLFNQFVLTALPGTFIVFVVELTISVALIYVFVGNELIAILQAYEDAKNDSDVNSGDDDQGVPSLENIVASIPLWKLIFLALANAFIVAATVEETIKWLYARRALTRHHQDSNSQSSKSVYGILSSACVCGLGLAMVENNAYVLGLSTAKAAGNALMSTNKSVFLITLRDVLAFPVHVGATLSIAVTAATNIVNEQLYSHRRVALDDDLEWSTPPPKASMFKAWLTAVTYHGLFDGAAMIVAVLVAKKLLPSFMEGVVIGFQALLVVAFSVLLRARFRALVEREHALVVKRTEQQQRDREVGVERRGDDDRV